MKITRYRTSRGVRYCAPPLIALFLAATALAGLDRIAPSKDAKCPVCGMFVAKYPDWSTALTYRDGTVRYFDGPKDLFIYYVSPNRYEPARKRTDVERIVVKDYYSLAPIDGRTAWYVIGSNVHGPMGKELVPFAKRSDAEGFLQDHGGRRILRFGEVDAAILKTLQ